MNKLWYESKQLWLNVLAIVGLIFFGGELPTETVAMILALLNFLLRLITGKPIVWSARKKIS